jgi:hypothetical protein
LGFLRVLCHRIPSKSRSLRNQPLITVERTRHNGGGIHHTLGRRSKTKKSMRVGTIKHPPLFVSLGAQRLWTMVLQCGDQSTYGVV